MSKPAIFYAVMRDHRGRNGFTVLVVTTEKGGQLYGRELYTDHVTHYSVRDVLQRYDKLTEANAALERAEIVRKNFKPKVDAAFKEWQKLDYNMRQAIQNAAKGVQ